MNKIEKEHHLISFIKLKPVLWQEKHPQHRNRYELAKAWDQIAEACHEKKTWVRNKWKSLKTRMTDELRLIDWRSTEAVNAHISEWPHYESMKFMVDELTPIKSIGTLMNLYEKINSQNSAKDLNDSDLEFDDSALNISHYIMAPTKGNKQDKLMEIESRKLALLEKTVKESKASTASTSKTSEESEDMMYFRTLLPYVEMIEPEDKLSYREVLIQDTLQFAYKKKRKENQKITENKSKKQRIKSLEDSDDDVEIISWFEAKDVKPKIKVETHTSFVKEIKRESNSNTRPPTRNSLNEHSDTVCNYDNANRAVPNFNFIPIPIPYISPGSSYLFPMNRPTQQENIQQPPNSNNAEQLQPFAEQEHIDQDIINNSTNQEEPLDLQKQ